MRSRIYERNDRRIKSTIDRCYERGINTSMEWDAKKVRVFVLNRYLNVRQVALLNHLNFKEDV